MTKPPFPSITGPSVFSKDPEFNGFEDARRRQLRAAMRQKSGKQLVDVKERQVLAYSKAKA